MDIMVQMTGVDLLEVRQAAVLAGRTPETVRRWVWSGRLAARKQGNRLLVARGDVLALVGSAEPDRPVPTLAEWAESVHRLRPSGVVTGASAADLVLEDRQARQGFGLDHRRAGR
jgi:hypothetical protein